MSRQDKFYELLNTLKDGAEVAGTYALGAAGLACEGAEKLAEAVKLRCQATRVESELNGKLIEVGELVYAAHLGKPEDSEALEEKLRNIDILQVELDTLNDQLGRTAGPACPVCGASVQEGDRFCRICGGKLNEED